MPRDSLQDCSHDTDGGGADDVQSLFSAAEAIKSNQREERVLHYNFRAGAFIHHFEMLQSQVSNNETILPRSHIKTIHFHCFSTWKQKGPSSTTKRGSSAVQPL